MRIRMVKKVPRIELDVILINNGIKVIRQLIFPTRPLHMLRNLDLLLNSKFNTHKINHNFEAGTYLSHLRVTKSSDKVLAVGLGEGSTLIPICKILDCSNGGFYRCIEASISQIHKAKKNIDLNNIDDSKFEILEGFAGDKVFNSYGASNNTNLDINDYEFDVLEMDCEGSELEIIKTLKKHPRNIIVELHPRHFTNDYKDFDSFLELMKGKGFSYEFAYGHNGDYLDIEYARKYFNSLSINLNNDSCKENSMVHFFGSCPIVVTFSADKLD